MGSNKGKMFTYIKHFALNEQEENRYGLYTYTTEQALREIYLKPFKACIQKGKSSVVMTSFVRVGAQAASGSKALVTGVLREEWGFNGCAETDYIDHAVYMRPDLCLSAGCDLMMKSGGVSYAFFKESNTFKKMLRNATKHVLYSTLAILALE